MSMTTTLKWTVYDGTPETLPEMDVEVLVLSKDIDGGVHHSSCTLEENEDYGILEWDDAVGSVFAVSTGDLWAPWPEVPKVEIHA